LILALDWFGVSTIGNVASPLSLIPLFALVVSGALSNRELAHRTLRGNDLSYGIYLYHMLVINAVVASGWKAGAGAAFAVVGFTTLILAAISWRLVEGPALRLKSILTWAGNPTKGVST